MSSDPQLATPSRPRNRPGVVTGLFTGLITAAVALGVGQLVAGLTGSVGSPVVAVGGASIDLTPPPLKDFAISTFGSNDKTALVTGILVLLAVFAAVIGVAAVRRFRYGVAGLAVFTAIGLVPAFGIRVDPPTSTTSSIFLGSTPASANACLTGAMVRCSRSSTSCSSLARDSVTWRCLGPV